MSTASASAAPAAEPRTGLLTRLIGLFDSSQRYVRRCQPRVDAINALEPEFEHLTQQDLQDRLRKIRSQVIAAREAVEAAHAELPPPADSDTRRNRRKEIVDAEKAVLDEHQVEVFAAVREAAKRTLSMRHFDVQLVGGMVLHDGQIAEMKTGEGKTLTATLPLVLNALAGRGSHLVTVNDYLARRDAEWMGKIYRYLGLTVGVIQHGLNREARQRAYACDITYITNHEIGFDYLRDNSSAWRPEHLVLRELYYSIIDEVDSILVDEAKVPLIISASRGKPVERYRKIHEVVSRLEVGEEDKETKETTGDVIVDEKAKNATLTEDGQRKVEVALGIDNLNDSAHLEDMHLTGASLKANFCYKRDVDYIVGPGDGGVPSVIIVDPFTGRPQPGRRWSDGLHQAIEAKERVPIQDEQQTIATVTYQNFFLMYDRLAGMTGTAKTEEAEFVEVYRMPVVVVPTNKPLRRTDNADVVFKSEEWKLRGICLEIAQLYGRQQPVLVGTRSVEMSELVSARLRPDKIRLMLQMALLQWHVFEHEKQIKGLLPQFRERAGLPLEQLRPRDITDLFGLFELDPNLDSEANRQRLLGILEYDDPALLDAVLREGVPHEVLNARHHEREAQIVAQAGRLGAVTIATNMAGRGTDIVLGGNPEPDVEELLESRAIEPKSLAATLFIGQALKGDRAAALGHVEEWGGLPRSVLREVDAIRTAWQAEHNDVVGTGGLHILGTERHESRRIDNQLRGRSGRQGDPGSARFYISLEDELMRLFAPDRFKLLMRAWPDEQPVEDRLVSKSMSTAQKKVEGRNFEMRKTTLKYDDVMNIQRLHVYAERRRILEGVDLRQTVSAMMRELVLDSLNVHAPPEVDPEDWDWQDLWRALNARFPIKDQLTLEDLRSLPREELQERLINAAERAYDDKENDFIRAVVEFELQANIHETLQQVGDRNAVCAVLNSLWPLADYLPSRLEGVGDNRVPETLFHVVREALEAEPRAFIQQVVYQRVHRAIDLLAARLAEGVPGDEVVAALEDVWPLELGRPVLERLRPDNAAEVLHDAANRALEERGWTFVPVALRRQMDRTVEALVPRTVDLEALLDEIDLLWPLAERLNDRQLPASNYGVVEERLHRTAEEALGRDGMTFVAETAQHRLAQAQPDEAAPVDDEHLQAAVDAVLLEAFEHAAVQSMIEAHRSMSAGGDEDEDDDDRMEAGELQRLFERINRDWPIAGQLDAWALERLGPTELRRAMADQMSQWVRQGGLTFAHDTARHRIEQLIHTALHEHYSLEALCATLNQAFELPGAFIAADYQDIESVGALADALSARADEVLGDDPERRAEFERNLRGWLDEHVSLRRLCDRLNQELPGSNLQPRDLTGLSETDLEPALRERLAGTEDAYTQVMLLDAVREHLRATIDEALARHYDLRRLSAQLAANWPVRPDDVRSSKLKGWAVNELDRRLKATLLEAYRGEEWRFIRRFVLRLLEDGLREVLARHSTGALTAATVAAICADLNDEWPLHQPLEPGDYAGLNRSQLEDELMEDARRAYTLVERGFVRRTARHRFGAQLERTVQEHYSLFRAAAAVNQAWNLGDAVHPDHLAEVRRLVEAGQPVGGPTVDALIEAVLPAARVTFQQQALEHRLADSVDDVLRRSYNTGRLLQGLIGRWPLPRGGLSASALRGLPYREMVERVRRVVETADAPLQHRLVFHHLRQSIDGLDLEPLLPPGEPSRWQLGTLAERLSDRVPYADQVGLATAADLAAGLLHEVLQADVVAVAGEHGAQVTPLLQAAVRRRAEADLNELLRLERRPQALADGLAWHWPLAADFKADKLRGENLDTLRQALLGAVDRALTADPMSFLHQAARLWQRETLRHTLTALWPERTDNTPPGPWVMAQICAALNERWQRPELLHPSQFKGLSREAFQRALEAQGEALVDAVVLQPFLREVLGAELRHGITAAAAQAIDRDGRLDLDDLVAALSRHWPEHSVPCATTIAARLTPDMAVVWLRDRAESLEERAVAGYESEPVRQWLSRRLDEVLADTCSLQAAVAALAERWPMPEVDLNALSDSPYQQVRDQLLAALLEACRQNGQAFARRAARLRLQADIAEVAAAPDNDAVQRLLARWPLDVAASEVRGGDREAVQARLSQAAEPLTAEALEQVFHHETVRRRLWQSVQEAQREHCNPELASDRWDREAMVQALRRLWPINGQLSADMLTDLPADALAETARDALFAAFDGHEDSFIDDTARLRLRHGLRDALDRHASLEQLAQVLTQRWPREAEFTARGLLAERNAAVPVVLGELAGTPDGLVNLSASPDDLNAVAAEFARRYPQATHPSAEALDEAAVSEALLVRLEEEFAKDPRSFVKAVALEDVPRQLERRLMLEAIDTNWCNHLEAMDHLREGINLRGYGQTDPFIAFRKDGRQFFENMLGRIRETVVAALFETTDQHLVEMHAHGRLGLRIAVAFENVREMAAKAEDLTGRQRQPAEAAGSPVAPGLAGTDGDSEPDGPGGPPPARRRPSTSGRSQRTTTRRGG